MEIIEWILLMLAVGAAAGFVAGLAGIGGGMLLVPALYFIYQSMHLAHQGVMHPPLPHTTGKMTSSGLFSGKFSPG